MLRSVDIEAQGEQVLRSGSGAEGSRSVDALDEVGGSYERSKGMLGNDGDGFRQG